jgi:hypothetical protein
MSGKPGGYVGQAVLESGHAEWGGFDFADRYHRGFCPEGTTGLSPGVLTREHARNDPPCPSAVVPGMWDEGGKGWQTVLINGSFG